MVVEILRGFEVLVVLVLFYKEELEFIIFDIK